MPFVCASGLQIELGVMMEPGTRMGPGTMMELSSGGRGLRRGWVQPCEGGNMSLWALLPDLFRACGQDHQEVTLDLAEAQ